MLDIGRSPMAHYKVLELGRKGLSCFAGVEVIRVVDHIVVEQFVESMKRSHCSSFKTQSSSVLTSPHLTFRLIETYCHLTVDECQTLRKHQRLNPAEIDFTILDYHENLQLLWFSFDGCRNELEGLPDFREPKHDETDGDNEHNHEQIVDWHTTWMDRSEGVWCS